MPEQWLTKKQAAQLANVSTKTIDRAIARQALRPAKNGVRKVLIAYSELTRWMTGGEPSGVR
jgi:excisionase family DNA binding protein